MYYCLNCENRFDEPINNVWEGIKFNTCPICLVDDWIPIKPCEQCSELKEDNGDKYCESCRGEVDKEISAAVEELKTRWDSELVNEALTEWLENQ